jgi:hypothetical protein
MREKFGAFGTFPCYPSTAQAVAVRRITTEGRKVSRAGGATTGESIRAFLACRGSPGGKVCRGGGEGGRRNAGRREGLGTGD